MCVCTGGNLRDCMYRHLVRDYIVVRSIRNISKVQRKSVHQLVRAKSKS